MNGTSIDLRLNFYCNFNIVTARHGGLGIPIPTAVTSHQLRAWSSATAPLLELIQQQSNNYLVEARIKQRQLKATISTSNHNDAAEEAKALKPKLSNAQQRAMEQAGEKGASSWLTCIPLAKYNFSLHEQAFRDALYASDLDGDQPKFHCSVHVESCSAASKEHCYLSDTIAFKTSQQISLQRCAQKLDLSQLSSP